VKMRKRDRGRQIMLDIECKFESKRLTHVHTKNHSHNTHKQTLTERRKRKDSKIRK